MKLIKLFDDLEVFPEDNEQGELAVVYQIEDSKYFLEVGRETKRKRIYQLNTNSMVIAGRHHAEILDYCLGKGNYPEDTKVTMRDIYLWNGEYFDLICDRDEMAQLDEQLINLN